MKPRDDKASIRNAKTVIGGPRLAKMLRELYKPKGQDVRKIWKWKEAGQ